MSNACRVVCHSFHWREFCIPPCHRVRILFIPSPDIIFESFWFLSLEPAKVGSLSESILDLSKIWIRPNSSDLEQLDSVNARISLRPSVRVSLWDPSPQWNPQKMHLFLWLEFKNPRRKSFRPYVLCKPSSKNLFQDNWRSYSEPFSLLMTTALIPKYFRRF